MAVSDAAMRAIAALAAARMGNPPAGTPTSMPAPNPAFRGALLGPNQSPPQYHQFPTKPGFDPNVYAVEWGQAKRQASRLAKIRAQTADGPLSAQPNRLFFNDPGEANDYAQALAESALRGGVKPWKGKAPEVLAIPKAQFGAGGTGSAVNYVGA